MPTHNSVYKPLLVAGLRRFGTFGYIVLPRSHSALTTQQLIHAHVVRQLRNPTLIRITKTFVSIFGNFVYLCDV